MQPKQIQKHHGCSIYIHSGKPLGTAMTQYDDECKTLRILIADNGMGFGLYTTSRLVDSIGKEFILHSGRHKLIIKDGSTSVIENGFWQGTLIYMEIGTGEEIDPNQIVDHRANAAEEYNEAFVETGELESLW